ncbi:lipoyl(octanoyl) transferase LipB [Marinospirillum perlucidum]|uniref:lipoyl(octanoyl) transferase LipB n=1 Tax=Marinospirillum perlucidum TaxID=1982602 RepID=UPI000DF272F2|nr:lipoyl(octanoyl) transferase LipB [Marinospirillum perlucidum]
MSDPGLLQLRYLGRQPYEPVWKRMQAFTQERTDADADELWILEHDSVFTLGQAGKEIHLLDPGDIPVVKVDRGGQVTWHGPGQLVIYLLLNVKRLSMGVRDLVNLIEESIIDYLASLGIEAQARADAPGVYVGEAKIAALGLKIRRGCSFHGLSFNLDCELEAFRRINPCGYAGMPVTRLADLRPDISPEQAREDLLQILLRRLGHQQISTSKHWQELA